jgi:hypothetical protein
VVAGAAPAVGAGARSIRSILRSMRLMASMTVLSDSPLYWTV